MFTGILFASIVTAAENAQTMEQKFSYAVGFQFAQDLKQKGIEVDPKQVVQAVSDVLSGSPLKVSVEDMQAAINDYQQKQRQQREALARKNQQVGMEFLAKNKKEKGVKETASGLQYKVIKEGDGKAPAPGDTVTVNYRGMLLNGQEFDSSYKRGEPATLPVNGVIKGWQEALPMMKEGAKWEIYVPSELAYGQRGAGNSIGPNETLVFDIELINVKQSAKN
jgi:FKBP-type peptidyl-prolyl cis-trans isomerase FklB